MDARRDTWSVHLVAKAIAVRMADDERVIRVFGAGRRTWQRRHTQLRQIPLSGPLPLGDVRIEAAKRYAQQRRLHLIEPAVEPADLLVLISLRLPIVA